MKNSEQKYLHEIHKDNNEWIKIIDFAKDEIATFNNRLAEVVSKNTKTEILAKAEHFQNQFIRHNEVIDILKHDINEYEHSIVSLAKENNVATDHRKAPVNVELLDRMDTFDRIWNELKSEYAEYLSEVL
jgi:hypothetical protein